MAPDVAEEHDVDVIPLNTHGGILLFDGMTLRTDTFRRRLNERTILPKAHSLQLEFSSPSSRKSPSASR